MEHMTNIASFKKICEERGATLKEQLDNLDKDHPLQVIRRTIRRKRRGADNLLLTEILKSRKHKKFEQSKSEMPMLSLPTFLRNEREKELTKSITVCYTSTIAGQTRTKTDSVFYINDSHNRHNALRWRCNKVARSIGTFGPNKKIKCSHCTVCKTRWERDHVKSCPLVTDSNDISTDQWARYSVELRRLALKYPQARHYTIVDSLLNNGDASTFASIFKTIESNIVRTYSLEPLKIRFTLASRT
jgi:hypothetical protein